MLLTSMGKSAYIHVKRRSGGINNAFGPVMKRKPTVAGGKGPLAIYCIGIGRLSLQTQQRGREG